MSTAQKILVPTNFCEHSERALQKALEISDREQANVYLLHVIDDTLYQNLAEQGVCDSIIDKIRAVAEKPVRIRMGEILNALPDARKARITSAIKYGVAADVILNEQEEKTIDLIVIGSEGRTGLRRYLNRSIAEKVARKAACQVSVIKKKTYTAPPPDAKNRGLQPKELYQS